MTTPLPAPTLTDAEIDRLEASTRADLHYAITGLATLRQADAHTRRGYEHWHEYVLAVFGDLLTQLRIPREVRLTLVDSMDQAGMTVREIADKIGVATGTVQNDREALGKVIPMRRRRPKCPTPAGRKWEQAAEHLRRYGEQGLTLVELAKVMGISEGSASGLLSYLLSPRKRLAVRTEQRRDGQRVHVLAEATSATV